MKIAILIPSMGTWRAEFGMSLANLVANEAYENSRSIEIIHADGTLLPQSRTELVEAALKSKATHVLFCDADITFPDDALGYLWNKDIIGVNYPTRRKPYRTTASVDGNRLPPSTGRADVQEVDVLGMGFVLIKREVFEKVPKPWFTTGWLTDENGEPLSVISEDAYFFRKCKEHGFQPYVDHALSQNIGHVGSVVFTHDMLK